MLVTQVTAHKENVWEEEEETPRVGDIMTMCREDSQLIHKSRLQEDGL